MDSKEKRSDFEQLNSENWEGLIFLLKSAIINKLRKSKSLGTQSLSEITEAARNIFYLEEDLEEREQNRRKNKVGYKNGKESELH